MKRPVAQFHKLMKAGAPIPARLVGALRDSGDTLPAEMCEALDLPHGTTYYDVAAKVRWVQLKEEERRADTIRPVLLYFTDQTAPPGQRFLGAAIIEAPGFLAAVSRAHQLGINPGGTVMEFDCPPHDPSMRERLITDDEDLETLGFTRRAQS